MRPVDRHNDLLLVRRELEGRGLAEAVLALEAPRPWASVSLVLAGWVAIGLAFASAAATPWLVAPGLVLAAVGVRLLNNLLHEASHVPRSLGALGRAGVELLLAAPLFEDARRYRHTHRRHHARLGEPDADPDYRESDRDTPLGVYASFLLDPRAWRASVLGDLPAMSGRQRARVALWWLVALALLAAAAGPGVAAAFAGFWLATRATTFHALRVFTELTDHVGLEPGGVIAYARTAPSNPLSLLLHPLHDNYHGAHHLFPRVPMVSLRRAHALLMHVDAYRDGPRCDGYFLGRRTVVRSWCRRTAATAG